MLRYSERGKINVSWLANRLGENRQTVWNWLTQKRSPQDPTVWTRMALELGLATVDSAVMESVREFALDVLVKSQDEELRMRAANLIREISKKSSP